MSWNMRIKRSILLLVALGVRLSSASLKEASSTGGASMGLPAGEAKGAKRTARLGLSSASSKEAPSTGDTIGGDGGWRIGDPIVLEDDYGEIIWHSSFLTSYQYRGGTVGKDDGFGLGLEDARGEG